MEISVAKNKGQIQETAEGFFMADAMRHESLHQMKVPAWPSGRASSPVPAEGGGGLGASNGTALKVYFQGSPFLYDK